MGPVGRGRALGVVFVAGVHGFRSAFHLVMRKKRCQKEVSNKLESLTVSMVFCLTFWGIMEYRPSKFEKSHFYMLNGFVSRQIAYFFPQGSSPIDI